MMIRRTNLFLIYLLTTIGLFCLIYVARQADNTYLKAPKALYITDLCLTTEARHLRHITLPEPLSAFQDIPGYLDHYPSAGFIRNTDPFFTYDSYDKRDAR